MNTQKNLVCASFSSTILRMDKSTAQSALRDAVNCFPSLKAFSDEIGVPYQVVQQWRVNGVPAEYCPLIERLTSGRVRSEDLNPRVDWTYIRGSSS